MDNSDARLLDDLSWTPCFWRPRAIVAIEVPAAPEQLTRLRHRRPDGSIERQEMRGPFYEMCDEHGEGIFALPLDTWRGRHAHFSPDMLRQAGLSLPARLWTQRVVPDGHWVQDACMVAGIFVKNDRSRTLIKFSPGALLLRFPDDSLQCMQPDEAEAAYYTPPEVEAGGYADWPSAGYYRWAANQALAQLRQSPTARET